jgi:hypothetical protein
MLVVNLQSLHENPHMFLQGMYPESLTLSSAEEHARPVILIETN